MKAKWLGTAAILLTLAVAYPSTNHEHHVLFQTSTISALLVGVYDGELTFKELRRHGDFGLGTFNHLDGEMVALEGRFYQVKTDGVAYPVSDTMRTPFADVTFFKPDRTTGSSQAMDLPQLQRYLDSLVESRNVACGFRIDGAFDFVKTRSVPAQIKPYPPLVEAAKHQATFEFHNVKGTLVGFRTPTYMAGVNVPGYHFHFLTQDRKHGGHVFDCRPKKITVALEALPQFLMELPPTEAFRDADLEELKQKELEKVEK